MKNLTAVFVIFLFATAAKSQNPYTAQLPWPDKIALSKVPEKYKDASAVCIMDVRKVEYSFEGKELFVYYRYYKRIRVQDDKGIERYNKIYVPQYRNAEMSNLKARTILPSGKMLVLPTEKIKEVDEEGTKYKMFAMEGVEKGCEVEYTYTLKKYPVFYGSEIFQSSLTPTLNAEMSIVVPSHLQFKAKGCNGFNVSTDTLVDNYRFIIGSASMIDEMEDEKYAVVKPYLQRVDFKLGYNLSNNNSVELFTWKEFSKNVYTNFSTLTEKEEKSLKAFIKMLNIPEKAGEEEKVKLVEDYIKKNFNINDELVSEESMNIKSMIDSKNLTNDGALRLMLCIYETLGISCNMVFPSVRDEYPLEEDLAVWTRVEKSLLYFPKTGQYLSPESQSLRYPYIPAYSAGTRGLFLKTTKIGDMKTAVVVFNDIEMIPFDQHATNMEVEVNFDAALDSLIVKSKQILLGYGAIPYRPIYNYLTPEKQKEANIEIIKNVAKSERITDIKVENFAFTDLYDNKPLIISGTITSGELIESAGNKLLLKVGELIGAQEQMYQEKPRQLPVELEYPHVLNRKIIVHIPEGYVVKNLNDLNMDVQYKKENEVSFGFLSKYTQSGNTITVEVFETYREIRYPMSDFENFKKVINAAADFNKITLVLEKK
jgi:Domain of Unknown Function with PDB structure (DUF3857)